MSQRRHCLCPRCVEIGGSDGLLINSSTARNHRQHFSDAAAGPSFAASSTEPPPKRQRRQPGPTPAQLLDNIFSTHTVYRSSHSLECNASNVPETMPLSVSPPTDTRTDFSPEEQFDMLDHTQAFEDRKHMNSVEWSEHYDDEEISDDEEEELIDSDAISIAARLFDREGSSMSSVALSEPQSNVDSWVWKTHVFVIFLMAYTALLHDQAANILSFVFAILGPLIERDRAPQHERNGSRSRHHLHTPSQVAKRLNLIDRFNKYLVCIACHKLNVWNGVVPADGMLKCAYCPAFTIYESKPRLVYAQRTIEMIVAAMLQDRRLEEALHEASQHGPVAAHDVSKQYSTIWSGKAWRQDCSLIGCETPCKQHHEAFVDDSTLNLKVSLNVDWFGPFKGGHSGTHSIGAILLRIDNLPARFSTLDRRCRGIHLVSLLPGPNEAKFPAFEECLRLIVDEIHHLDDHGVKIATALHPEGRIVRTRLNMVVADSPARAKVVGFTGNRLSGNICPYCPKHSDNFGTREAWEDELPESWPTPSGSSAPVAPGNTIFDKLSYFDRKLDSPPDPMHAVYLGICKRFWHQLLIEACGNIRGRLKEAQKVIGCAIVPSSIKRPDRRIGSTAGGMPTAEEWATLFRCLLPFVMLDLWGETLMHGGQEALTFDSEQLSKRREFKDGPKAVTDVFEMGMLLCCIADMIDGDFEEDEVVLLHSYILRYNAKSKDTLGIGWLVFNNHIVEHIPDAIRRFGAPKHFSCLPFERTNGILGKIKTSGRKGGQIELSMMRKVVNRLELRHLLAQSNDSFFRETLLGYIQSRSEHEDSPAPTRLAKKEMESDTYHLLLSYLNGSGKSFSGRFMVPHDPEATSSDIVLRKDAIFLRTVVRDTYPSEMRVSGIAGEGRTNKGNTFAMVKLGDGEVVPVHIRWLFEKRVQINGPGTAGKEEQFMHIRRLKSLTMHETFGCEVPNADLLDRLSILFASTDEVGEDMVLPLRALVSQVVVVPFRTHNPQRAQVYGIKRL